MQLASCVGAIGKIVDSRGPKILVKWTAKHRHHDTKIAACPLTL